MKLGKNSRVLQFSMVDQKFRGWEQTKLNRWIHKVDIQNWKERTSRKLRWAKFEIEAQEWIWNVKEGGRRRCSSIWIQENMKGKIKFFDKIYIFQIQFLKKYSNSFPNLISEKWNGLLKVRRLYPYSRWRRHAGGGTRFQFNMVSPRN